MSSREILNALEDAAQTAVPLLKSCEATLAASWPGGALSADQLSGVLSGRVVEWQPGAPVGAAQPAVARLLIPANGVAADGTIRTIPNLMPALTRAVANLQFLRLSAVIISHDGPGGSIDALPMTMCDMI